MSKQNSLYYVVIFLRQVASSALIIFSIFLAIAVAIEISTPLPPPTDPSEQYKSLVVDLYLEAVDWDQIHNLEELLGEFTLSIDYQDKIYEQVWRNYIRSQEENRYTDYIYDVSPSFISTSLGKKHNEFYLILKNRDLYLADETSIALYTRREVIQKLEDIITNCQIIISKINSYIEAYHTLLTYEAGNSALSNFNNDCDNLTDIYNISIVRPKYNKIVYDSLIWPERDEDIVNLATDIMYDLEEEPLLRLYAITYLKNYMPKKLIEDLASLIEDAQERGTYFGERIENTLDESFFEQQLLIIFRDIVKIDTNLVDE